jgi:N-methylhydantoinase B
MTNSLNTPVEALERAIPVTMTRYSLRRGSGGDGRYRGGDGIVREFRFLAPAEVTLLSERRRLAPWGLAGGQPGEPGEDSITRNGDRKKLTGKFRRRVERGDVLTLMTPGGGGWGKKR